MTILSQVEKRLSDTRKAQIRVKLFSNLEKFSFEVEQTTRTRGEDDWTSSLTPIGPGGELIRGLKIKVKTPSPLDFERRYSWDLIQFCSCWINYKHPEGSFSFKLNTGRGNTLPIKGT